MKKLLSAFLVLVFILSLISVSALAAGSFDKSVFENSRKFSKEGFGWKLIGGYEKKFAEARISVRTMLFDNYVTQGWGPELRVEYYDYLYKDYDEVTGFKASVDGVIYSFDNLQYDDSEDVHGGSVFGGTVYQAFMKDILDCKDVMFQITHTDAGGDTYTSTIEHVHSGDLSPLQEMAKYLMKSNAFSTDSNPAGNDSYYKASIS